MSTTQSRAHEHEWERGIHMAEAFGVDGREYACAICGVERPRHYPNDNCGDPNHDAILEAWYRRAESLIDALEAAS